MAGHEAPDRPRRSPDPPPVVVLGVTVLPGPNTAAPGPNASAPGRNAAAPGRNAPARPADTKRGARLRRRGIVALALGGALALAAALTLAGPRASGVSGRGERGKAGRHTVNVAAHQPGPAGVAAAYGHPLGCLSITIPPASRTYARADFNHASPCGRYTGYPTAIFHYASGAWRPVLEAVSYRCPVDSLPVAVQRDLAVCL